jgi:cell filamentation protein
VSQDDKYTYPNSGGVLLNKLSITAGPRLDEAMNELASAVWTNLSTEPTPAVFDFTYLQHLHSMMFSNLFDWAGRVRDVDTVAGNTGKCSMCATAPHVRQLRGEHRRIWSGGRGTGTISKFFAMILADEAGKRPCEPRHRPTLHPREPPLR